MAAPSRSRAAAEPCSGSARGPSLPRSVRRRTPNGVFIVAGWEAALLGYLLPIFGACPRESVPHCGGHRREWLYGLLE